MISKIPFTLSFIILAGIHFVLRAGYAYWFVDYPWAGGGAMWGAVTLSLMLVIVGLVMDLVSRLRRGR